MTDEPRPPGNRFLRVLKRLYLPIWAVIIIAVLEYAAGRFVGRPNRLVRRSADPEMGYEQVPGTWIGHAKFDPWKAPIYMILDVMRLTGAVSSAETIPGDVVYRIDDDGCRIPEDAPAGSPETADAVFLGSSQSFGLFVPEDGTVVAILEKLLREKGFKGIRVANCGVMGHHFTQTLRAAEILTPHKRPKLNIVFVRPWHLREAFDYMEVVDPANPLLKWLIDRSNVARLLYYVALRQTNHTDSPPVSAARLNATVEQYVQDMNKQGVQSLFILVNDGTSETGLLDNIEPILRQHHLPLERIIAPNSANREYFVDHDGHWSQKGAAEAAAEILDMTAAALPLAGVARQP